jgi:putative acetyltransferase
VLGEPAYYARFGFEAAVARAFQSAYSGPHFMGLRLNENAPQGGKVRYPAAFADLG